MKQRLPSIDFVSVLPPANIALSLLVAAGRNRPKAASRIRLENQRRFSEVIEQSCIEQALLDVA